MQLQVSNANATSKHFQRQDSDVIAQHCCKGGEGPSEVV